MRYAKETIQNALKPHPMGAGVMGRIPLDYGYILSIVGGPHLYGDGVDTFEVAVIADSTGELIDLPNGDTVQGWVTMDQILAFVNASYGLDIGKSLRLLA